MIATRRRGYKSVTETKVPKVAVVHPDAWMYKVVATATRNALYFSYTWETNGRISKIIIDDTIYKGDGVNSVYSGGKILVPVGEHTIYVYFTANDVCGMYNDLGNEKIIPYEMRPSRNNIDDNLSCYYPGSCTYYLCCNKVMYPSNVQKAYFNKNNTHIYVPVGMQQSYLNNATWIERGMTEDNFIEVNYNFIED